MLNPPPPLRPALRTDALGFSDIVKIRNRVAALRQSGTHVLQLEGGEPFPDTPAFVKDAIKLALDENQTRYAASSGIAPLIEAIRIKLLEKNAVEARTEQIIVTSGGMHGLFCAFQAVLNPGDEVLFFSPYWTPIRDLVTYGGATPVLVPWAEVRAGDVTSAIESRLTLSSRVIYVNTPSNPTGDVLSAVQLEAIAAIAREHNLIVISDEAYEDLVYDTTHVSIASLPGMFERTLTVFTLSKSFSMTGLRVGYVVAADVWMEVLRKLVLNSVNGISTPTQYGAAAAIADRSGHFGALRSEYRKRRDILVEGALAAGFRCSAPRGAFYLFADVRDRLGDDSWKAMNDLLERTSIATVPGAVFGAEGEGHLRMSYSTSLHVLEQVSAALKKL